MTIVGLVENLTTPRGERKEPESEGGSLLWREYSLTPSQCHEAVKHALGLAPEDFHFLATSSGVKLHLDAVELIQAINLWP